MILDTLAQAEPWQPCDSLAWRCSSAKRLYSIWLGKMLQPEPSGPADEEVPYLKAQHVQWAGVTVEELPAMFANPMEIEKNLVALGDLLVCEGGEVGRAALLTNVPPPKCILQNALHRVRPKGANDLRFLKYLLRHAADHGWFEVLCNRATIAHFTAEKFGDIRICYPAPGEQRAIADFLDRETGRLDGLIAAKERLLEILAEKRRAIITQAVTRGLNLDVPMKESGVHWLGEIPAQWTVVRLKLACSSLQTGPFGSQLHAEDYIENGTPVINPAHLSEKGIVPDMRVTVDEGTSERLMLHQLAPGDVVFSRRGELGRCAIVQHEQAGWLCGTGSLRARLKLHMLVPEYLAFIFGNTSASAWLTLLSVGSTMDNLNTEMLGAFAIILPPLEEQRAIVAHLAAETAKLDALRAAAMHSIDLLKERRTALISAAVCGFLDIPGVYNAY